MSQPGSIEENLNDKEEFSVGNSGVEHSSQSPVEGRAGELREYTWEKELGEGKDIGQAGRGQVMQL